jgi:mono/diheme cytochrome c family protein
MLYPIVAGLLILGSSNGDAPLAIGAKVAAFTFTDTRWLPRSLDDFGERKAFVIVFTSLDCPVAQRVMPRMAEIEPAWRARGVQFLSVDVGPGDPLVEVAARAVEQNQPFPAARDFDGEVVRALRPQRTPEIVVLDGERKLRYRGRFDASERLGGNTSAAVRGDLEQALEDVLAGKAVARPTTPVDGCKITPEPDEEHDEVPMFATDVAPILNEHCASCHSQNGSGPFDLTTFESASRHAAMIGEVVEQGRMPPWYASAKYGKFENERRLSDADRKVIAAWVLHGAPAGDLARAPKPPVLPMTASGWRIGEPDLVLTVATPTKVPATGTVPYQYVVLPYVFLHDTWIDGIEIRPQAKKVLHHANMAWYQIGGDFKSSNFITGQVPGGDPMDLRDGMAVLVPKGSVLGLQIHYVPNGEATEDRISVGLRFPRDVVHKRMRHFEVANRRFKIPPAEPAYPVKAKRTFDADAIGVGMFVHMHLRGRDMKYVARSPDGAEETLLLVPNYSFDWQMAYRWSKGERRFEKGTTVECLAHFDNSAFNAWNPDPQKTVTFGEETVDEMMYGFLFYVNADEDLNLRVDPKTGAPQ